MVAGGVGRRFGGELPKQFLSLGGRPLLFSAWETLIHSSEISGVVAILPADFVDLWREVLAIQVAAIRPGLSHRVVVGGETRQGSVAQGLKVVPEDVEWILVHDAARPLFSENLVTRCCEAARGCGAAVAALPVADTLKRGNASGEVVATVSRDQLFRIQTPQVFRRSWLEEALRWAGEQQKWVTDEATLFEEMGRPVALVEGEESNFKVTRPEDLKMAEVIMASRHGGTAGIGSLRIGEGFDVHPFVEGRDLILGGVKIPFHLGLQGHSDADALLHAISDALLGAAALGDLGAHFPDTDSRYRGASSLVLLAAVRELLEKNHFTIMNVDATLVCQKPKIAPHVPAMRENIAKALQVDLDRVSVKATTEEGLGYTGSMAGLQAKAVALISKNRE